MEQTWRHQSPSGDRSALIHPETHFTDEKAGLLRAATYERLRRHWQFINELDLFEIQNQSQYGVHVYGSRRQVGFLMAASLYHPDTVERSLAHDGSGEEPGLKDPDGNWDLRPHRNRIIKVDDDTLADLARSARERECPSRSTRMVYAVNRATAAVLESCRRARRLGTLALNSRGLGREH